MTPTRRSHPPAPRVLAAIALLALLPAAQAAAYTLNFSGNICSGGSAGTAGNAACGNGTFIGSNYGDVAGVVDVAYRSFTTASGATFETALKYWGPNYSDLTGVAWGGPGPRGYTSEITFTPAPGSTVTLNSFQFGDYLNRNFGSSATILDAATQAVLWSSGAFDPGLTAIAFAPLVSSVRGLVLRWGPDGYDVGIDNVDFAVTAVTPVTPVPEPGTLSLMLAGAGLLGAVASRRHR